MSVLPSCVNKRSVHNKKNQTEIVYIDYSKAFDEVFHDKLLHKLESCGINDEMDTVIFVR